MLTLISLVALLGFLLLAISLKKSYSSVRPTELKRLARNGDKLAKMLHRAVAYGTSLTILLWLIIGLAGSAFFVLLTRSVPAWAAFLASLLVVWFGFAWLPNSRTGLISDYSARWFTPLVAWLLRQFRPVFGRLEQFVNNHVHLQVHTGIYEKDDLLELLKNQKKQLDSRITKDELRIVAGALKFSDKTVAEVMTPRRRVKMVKATDSVGPVLMSELHKSGHSRFPVYEGKTDNIVGILYLHDLVEAKSGGKASELMSRKVYYVNEDFKLGHVLQAILKTKHHLFIAVNNFEDVVGVISIEDILEQIIGQPIMDEFDKYEDKQTVANLTTIEKEPEEKIKDKK
ncbi:MAG TPA: CBS domain-containing protein [Candidatus Saccharimonadales bacterium]|nr:CBS domain-containing protein [Candidatus Saccharimonadales bacterium]